MLETDTRGTPLADGASAAPSFEDAMAVAFPPLDATEETVAELANVAPDVHLLAATPARAELDYEKLEEEVARTRVIFIRGEAAIPLTAIVAIGGALLIHFLFVGGFLLALWLAVTKHGGFGEGPVLQEGGGPTGGMMVSGDGPQGDPAIDASAKDILLHAGAQPIPAAPALPHDLDLSEAPQQLAAASLESSPTDSPLIGIPSGDDPMGSPKPPAPPARVPLIAPPQNDGVVVVPPSHDPQSTKPTILASAGSQTHSPSSPKGGIGSGGGEVDYGEEPVIELSKGDPGSGKGSGHQAGGGGIDHGASGANQPEPQILEWEIPEFSEAVNLNRPPQSTKCKVLVLASGQAGKIDIVQSCGQPGLDQMLVMALKKAKFRPAYRNGRPYDADKDVELKYGNP